MGIYLAITGIHGLPRNFYVMFFRDLDDGDIMLTMLVIQIALVTHGEAPYCHGNPWGYLVEYIYIT